MSDINGAFIGAAIAAFCATNVDDFAVLLIFFLKAQVDTTHTFRSVHVVVGQLLGFSCLVAFSLLGLVMGLFIPTRYIGIIGFIPILIGLSKLYQLIKEKCCDTEGDEDDEKGDGEKDEKKNLNEEKEEEQQAGSELATIIVKSGGESVNTESASALLPHLRPLHLLLHCPLPLPPQLRLLLPRLNISSRPLLKSAMWIS